MNMQETAKISGSNPYVVEWAAMPKSGAPDDAGEPIRAVNKHHAIARFLKADYYCAGPGVCKLSSETGVDTLIRVRTSAGCYNYRVHIHRIDPESPTENSTRHLHILAEVME